MARPKRRVSAMDTLAAPVGGIDDTSSLDNMDPKYAISMTNLFPAATSLEVRGGYAQWATGLPSPARTLFEYAGGAGAAELFAATDTGIYDITSSGAVGAAVHTVTDGYLITTMFANVADQYLVAVGPDTTGFLYDGSTFVDFVADATPVNPGEIDGVNPSLWCYVHSHKKRLWFIEKDSMTAWYLPVDAVAGVAQPFYLGSVFSRGGKLQSITTWTVDNGESIDDIIIFQSSKGELAGYNGTDPADATAWNLEAVYFIGPPLGDRTNTDIGGDLAFLTSYGVIPVSRIIGNVNTTGPREDAISKRISKTLNTIVAQRIFEPSWEINCYPTLQYLIVIIPPSQNYMPVQYVMNMVTGAWCSFDLPILTTCNHNEHLYFSDEGTSVFIYNTVTTDNALPDGTNGSSILASFQQAFASFNQPGVEKHFNLVRPVFSCSVGPSYGLAVAVDFDPNGLDGMQTPSPTIQGALNTWDYALWDQAPWTYGLTTFYEWVGVEGVGFSGSLMVKMQTSTALEFVSSTWAYEQSTGI